MKKRVHLLTIQALKSPHGTLTGFMMEGAKRWVKSRYVIFEMSLAKRRFYMVHVEREYPVPNMPTGRGVLERPPVSFSVQAVFS